LGFTPLSISEFFKKQDWEPKAIPLYKEVKGPITVMLGLWVLLVFFIALMYYVEHSLKKKTRTLLGS
jgi:hypothetical protein